MADLMAIGNHSNELRARAEIAAIKIAAPQGGTEMLERAIQLRGGGRVCDDFHWPKCGRARTPRLADRPDEIHMCSIARHALGRRHRDGDE